MSAKTIMLHSCDVEICEDTLATMWRKGKSRRKDEHIGWPERQMMLATRIQLNLATMWRKGKSRRKDEHIGWPERQMMLATRIMHIYRIFLDTAFQRM